MSNCRPVMDPWVLARPKLAGKRKYYGAYPAGFLERARFALGASIHDPVLHVCGGMARFYPYPRGFGKRDQTLDLDPALEPDFCQDARKPWPLMHHGESWAHILVDPPYSPEDADKYKAGRKVLPTPTELLRRAREVLIPGGRVGLLHYIWARPTAGLRSVAMFPIAVGFGNRLRVFGVYEAE